MAVAESSAYGWSPVPARGPMTRPSTVTGVLVTGSTSGIGEAIAMRLASDGAGTVVTGRDEHRGREVVERGGTGARSRHHGHGVVCLRVT